MENILTIEDEIFKSIPITNCEHYYTNRMGTKIFNAKSGKYVSIFPHSHPGDINKYMGCHLSNNRTYDVHRLVALAWIPNPDKKPTVDHIDKCTLNNCVDNLRWATCKEQTANSDNSFLRDKEYQLEMSRKGAEKKSRAINQYDKNTGELIGTYKSSCQAAMDFFGDRSKNSYINRCAHGKINEAYGYYWAFA